MDVDAVNQSRSAKRSAAHANAGLTPKQKRFAEALAAGATSATQAAKDAGYAPATAHVKASETVRNRKVIEHVEALRAKRIGIVDVSRAAHLSRLEQIAKEARAVGQYSAAARCEELMGKVAGLYIERTESLNINVELARMSPDAIATLMREISERINTALNQPAIEAEATYESLGDDPSPDSVDGSMG